MAVTLRNYRGPDDIDRQNAFWVQAARELPYCWKPTIAPVLYAKGAQFDPRSRCFAFEGDRFRNLASGHSAEELKMLELYFRSVDFDFSVTATSQTGRVAYLGFAVRPDTGFAELIAVALDAAVPDMAPCLASALDELRSRNVLFLGTGPVTVESAFETLVRMGFT